jgi:hypothetical protein
MTAAVGVPAGVEARRYVVRRDAPWPAPVHAYVVDSRGAELPLVHVERHSPDGFEYGYGGSGPADLALSILVDFFDLEGAPDRLPVSYQGFKWHFIASADRTASSFEIPGAAIAAWIRHELERRPATDGARSTQSTGGT